MKKKVIAIIVAAVVVAAGIFAAYKAGLFGGSSSDTESDIYVSQLSTYMISNSAYSTNTFMGVVEGQEAKGITKASDREIDEIYVSVGDNVAAGDKLFSYKTDSVQEEITSYGFDIESYQLQLDEDNRQMTILTNDMNKTEGAEAREDLQNQIDTLANTMAITQNSIDQVNAKIEDAKKKIENSVVCATSDGVITKISNDDDSSSYSSSDGYFITLLASDELRVKGTINEQNVYSINVDEPVTLRSRVDKSQTWSGVISKIDTDNTSSDSNSSDTYYSYGTDTSANSSTSYPFYVTLDNSDGLMMGQHLYIELGVDTETTTIDFTSGTYIYDYLLAYDEDGNSFVWTMGKGKKLAKTYVTLGDYNEDAMVYEVTDGITYDDYVAYPMDDYTEGMSCISE